MTRQTLARILALLAVALLASPAAEAGQRERRAPAKSAKAKPTKAGTAKAASAAAAIPTAAGIAKLAPEARIEQRCNVRAMGDISREHPGFAPDELVAYAFADPDTDLAAETIRAPGAAVRSKGEWYHLSYRCQTTAEGLDVVAFSYALGEMVPRSEWDAHYLVK